MQYGMKVLTLVGGLLVAAAIAPQASYAADAATIEAAKKEGQVVWYTTLIVNQAIRPLKQAFEAKYPGVTLEFSRANDGPTALKIMNEARAGQVQADIFDGLVNMISLDRAGLVAPFVPPSAGLIPA